MSKLKANEVRTSHFVNRYGDRTPYYLITVSSGDLYMKEAEEGEFGAAQIRENADLHIGECQYIKVPKWRMLKSKWCFTAALDDTNQFHIMEI